MILFILIIMFFFNINLKGFKEIIENKDRIIDLAKGVKSLFFEKNELQKDQDILKKSKKKKDQDFKNKNNSIFKIKQELTIFQNELLLLFSNYQNEEEIIINIVNILIDLDKKLYQLKEIEKKCLNLIIDSKNNIKKNIHYYEILDILLSLEQLLEYKKNIFFEKELSMEGNSMKLKVLYNFLSILIDDKNIVTK